MWPKLSAPAIWKLYLVKLQLYCKRNYLPTPNKYGTILMTDTFLQWVFVTFYKLWFYIKDKKVEKLGLWKNIFLSVNQQFLSMNCNFSCNHRKTALKVNHKDHNYAPILLKKKKFPQPSISYVQNIKCFQWKNLAFSRGV